MVTKMVCGKKVVIKPTRKYLEMNFSPLSLYRVHLPNDAPKLLLAFRSKLSQDQDLPSLAQSDLPPRPAIDSTMD